MKITAIVATTREQTDDKFTLGDINQLKTTSIGKPVLKNFMQSLKIGTVVDVRVICTPNTEDYLLQLIVEIDGFETIDKKYIVPGYTVGSKGRVISAQCYGLVDTPKDKTLPSVEVKYLTKRG